MPRRTSYPAACQSLLIACFVIILSTTVEAGETTDPTRATLQVYYGEAAGSGTAIAPRLVLTCAHIHAGEAAGQSFTIAKHWHDSTDQYRGSLLATDHQLDLALIAVHAADLNYVQLVASEPTTPQAASFYGHADARREILSFQDYISRGYTTHFDMVAGHDSIEGQSGGGVFNAQGELLGVMHGRPNRLPTPRGGGIFTPVRHIRQWIATDCRGPQCRRLMPPGFHGHSPAPVPQLRRYGQITPPPPREPRESEPRSDLPRGGSAPRPLDLQPIVSRLDALSERIDQLARQPGPPGAPGERGPAGPRGERGEPGASASLNQAELAGRLEASLLPIIDQRIEEAIARRVPHYFSIVPRNSKGN